MPIEIIVILVLLIILLLIIICHIKIVPQAQAYVMERLGAYHSTWGTGLHVKIPFADRISRKVSLKEQVVDKITASIRQTAASGSHFSKMLTPEEEEIMREIIREFMD